MKKSLPYGAKLEAIKKAMKKGQKFYLHTYIGILEVVGIDMNGNWALANERSWAICSTEINCWYSQIFQVDDSPIEQAISEFDALYQKGCKRGLNFKENQRFKVLEKFIAEEVFKLKGKEFDYLAHLLAEAVRK